MARWVDLDNPKIINEGLDKFGNVIYGIPPDTKTADVRPVVRGCWVYHPEATWQYECDNCGCYVPGVWTYCPDCGNLNGPNTITELNPGCGADMMGGDADGDEKD